MSANIPVISLWQPWASLCFAVDRERNTMAKAHETRGYKVPAKHVDVEVAIHATASFPPPRMISPHLHEICVTLFGANYRDALPRGAVIGIVRFAPAILTHENRANQCAAELAAGDWSDGRYAWPITDARRLDHPVPAKGKQGWWAIDVDKVTG